MSDRQEELQRADGSNSMVPANSTENFGISHAPRVPDGAGQSAKPESALSALPSAPGLGEPMTIEDVAALLGCSPWTVRQRYLRQGLPYLQARARGKLIFFREQIIAWVEKRQRQKGGIPR
jgi:hypothetical protein